MFSTILCCQEGKQALFRAAETGDIDAVKRQLSGHTDINSQDEVNVEHYNKLLFDPFVSLLKLIKKILFTYKTDSHCIMM